MKNLAKIFTAILLCCIVLSCKKKNQIIEKEPNQTGKPVAVEHGATIGVAVTKTIGSTGGVIEMPDSEVKITIPAGAVDAETVFSIQAVTNTLSKSGLKRSFRLLPETVEFKKDVEIVIPYNDEVIKGTSDELLNLAYQDAKGFWHAARNVILDKTSKTLKVKTKHFSDWTIYAKFYLEYSKSRLFANEESKLNVVIKKEDPSLDDLLGIDDEVPTANIEKWEIISGLGTLSGGNSAKQTFKAPAIINEPSQSLIQVSIKNDQGVKIAIPTIGIMIVPNEYIVWDIGAELRTPNSWSFGQSTGTNGYMQLSTIFNGNSLTIRFANTNLRTGIYTFGPWNVPGNVLVNEGGNGGQYWEQSYCSGIVTYLPGSMTINSIDGYLDANFSGTLMLRNGTVPGCNRQTEQIRGSFRLKMP